MNPYHWSGFNAGIKNVSSFNVITNYSFYGQAMKMMRKSYGQDLDRIMSIIEEQKVLIEAFIETGDKSILIQFKSLVKEFQNIHLQHQSKGAQSFDRAIRDPDSLKIKLPEGVQVPIGDDDLLPEAQ